MTSVQRPLLAAATAALIGAVVGLITADPARSQGSAAGLELIKGGSTPLSINGLQILNSLNCPLLVNPSQTDRQPLWIPPSQVATKNRLGCLSPSDALYRADGCPSQLCQANDGTIPLPGKAGAVQP